MATRTGDPRSIITSEAFTVAPELLGLPLASPWRRAAAMLLDLIPVAILVGAGGSVLLGVIAAVMLWRASSPARNQGILRTGVKGTLRVAAVLLVFVVVVRLWGAITDDAPGPDGDIDAEVEDLPLSLRDLAMIGPVVQMQRATDTAEVRASAAAVADWLAANEGDPETKRRLASDLVAELSGPARAAAERGLAAFLTVPEPVEPAGDSAVLRYTAALEAGDTAAQRTLRPAAAAVLAGDELDRLERRIERLREENRELQRDLEEEREGGGFIAWIRGIADDLGIGFGWTAVYFTSLLALWEGQTLGKRLLKVRVIRLDLRPIGWWLAFERFGGYAASLSTGLLGFLQILWDRNRQGLHDKAVETVVVREPEFRARMQARSAPRPPAPTAPQTPPMRRPPPRTPPPPPPLARP